MCEPDQSSQTNAEPDPIDYLVAAPAHPDDEHDDAIASEDRDREMAQRDPRA